jgi:hypothetical protein
MREKRGKLAPCFAAGAGHKRNKFAVKPGFANEQARWNRDANPAVLQDIHSERGAAGGELAIDADLVVDTREGCFDGRQLGITLGGKSASVKRPVIFDRQNNPARRMRGGLRVASSGKEEQKN